MLRDETWCQVLLHKGTPARNACPAVQKHAINALGFGYVMKTHDEVGPGSPLMSLDYRCHVAGGAIGTNYPPPVARCLRSLSDMSPERVRRRPFACVPSPLRSVEGNCSRCADVLAWRQAALW